MDPNGREAGYVEDHEGAGGFGHGAMYVQQEDGKYAFFEVIGISKNTNGISPETKPGSTVKDKWGTDTTVLSNSENSFPSKASSEKLGKPGDAGCLLRVFDTKKEMVSVLDLMGFDESVCFNTTKAQDSMIYDAALSNGKDFTSYNLLFNSCGIYANNSLTIAGSGIKPVDSNCSIFPFSGAIPNIIGGNLLTANPNASVLKIGGK